MADLAKWRAELIKQRVLNAIETAAWMRSVGDGVVEAIGCDGGAVRVTIAAEADGRTMVTVTAGGEGYDFSHSARVSITSYIDAPNGLALARAHLVSHTVAAAHAEPPPMVMCETCFGSGEVDESLGGSPPYGVIECPDCRGIGAIPVTPTHDQPSLVNIEDEIAARDWCRENIE